MKDYPTLAGYEEAVDRGLEVCGDKLWLVMWIIYNIVLFPMWVIGKLAGEEK